jgi:hypothetical protein
MVRGADAREAGAYDEDVEVLHAVERTMRDGRPDLVTVSLWEGGSPRLQAEPSGGLRYVVPDE